MVPKRELLPFPARRGGGGRHTVDRHHLSTGVVFHGLHHLCDLTGQPLPNRPVDGISLKPLLVDDMAQRPSPVFFWNYDASTETSVEREPYIDPQLQEGTTPLVKMMAGKYTRSFTNFHHPVIEESNYAGPKAVLASRYKLVIDGERSASRELFDIRNDPYETTNLIDDLPAIATTLENQLLEWQHSVLNSLTGADY